MKLKKFWSVGGGARRVRPPPKSATVFNHTHLTRNVINDNRTTMAVSVTLYFAPKTVINLFELSILLFEVSNQTHHLEAYHKRQSCVTVSGV